MTAAAPGETTARSNAFVAAHRDEAAALGGALAELIPDPDAFAAALQAGLRRLGDPEVVEGQRFVAPGIGPTHGVRTPLLDAVRRAHDRATRQDRAATRLYVIDRLFREPELEVRWLAFGLLERTVLEDPERSWQLMRRGAREAGDWITVDTLARPYAAGILAEPFRWAEIEQLVFSPSRWERRLVGSTSSNARRSTLPFGIKGISSSTAHSAGTMYEGSLPAANSRNSSSEIVACAAQTT